MVSTSPLDLTGQLLGRYGPLLGGGDLYSALGFKSYAAFHRGKQRGEIRVAIFQLPGRRGWFALTTDVAAWLSEHTSPDRLEPTKGDAK